MLEKGLAFAHKRLEMLDAYKAQLDLYSSAPDSQEKIEKLNQILLEYQNWFEPHMALERKDFVEESQAKFAEFKKIQHKLKNKKFKFKEIDRSKEFKLSVGTSNAGRR